jgi:hypothetical protein
MPDQVTPSLGIAVEVQFFVLKPAKPGFISKCLEYEIDYDGEVVTSIEPHVT